MNTTLVETILPTSSRDASIIIVNWNAKRFLDECLASIIRHTSMEDTEIIVVDNASSDGSQELVRESYPMVKLITLDSNLGFAKANNIGIRQSRGKYLFLINSDIKVNDDFIAPMKYFMDKHPDVGLLGPRIIGADGKLQRSCMGFPSPWNYFCRALALDSLFPQVELFGGYMMTYWGHDELRDVDVLCGCFWVARRKALCQVGLLDEDYFFFGEDIDWCRRFHEKGWKVIYCPNIEILHYGGASTANAPIKYYVEQQKSYLQYVEKHHSRVVQILFYWITVTQETVRIIGYGLTLPLRPAKRETIKYKIKRSVSCMKWLCRIAGESRHENEA
jgi:GT2 family glycosyltransferase